MDFIVDIIVVNRFADARSSLRSKLRKKYEDALAAKMKDIEEQKEREEERASTAARNAEEARLRQREEVKLRPPKTWWCHNCRFKNSSSEALCPNCGKYRNYMPDQNLAEHPLHTSCASTIRGSQLERLIQKQILGKDAAPGTAGARTPGSAGIVGVGKKIKGAVGFQDLFAGGDDGTVVSALTTGTADGAGRSRRTGKQNVREAAGDIGKVEGAQEGSLLAAQAIAAATAGMGDSGYTRQGQGSRDTKRGGRSRRVGVVTSAAKEDGVNQIDKVSSLSPSPRNPIPRSRVLGLSSSQTHPCPWARVLCLGYQSQRRPQLDSPSRGLPQWQLRSLGGAH